MPRHWTLLGKMLHARGRLFGLGVCLLLISLLSGGCSDTPSPSGTKSSSASDPPAAAPSSTVDLHFTDITSIAGLDFRHEAGATGKKWYPETMGSGGGFFDYDGDGRLDILLINGRHWPGSEQEPAPTMRLYRNQGDGTFQDVTPQSGLAIPLYGMGMTAADYDNDGDADLLVTGYRQTLLFRNDGHGSFTEVSAQAGITQGGWSTAAAFVDIDRDGFLDLLVGHYVEWEPSQEDTLDCTYGTPHKDYCAVKYFKGLGLQLYRNRGDGQFVDITQPAGVAAPEARVLGITIVDYNQDNWPDILVANDLTPSLFFANQGDGTFREIGVPSGLVIDEGGVAFAGMGIDTAYINNDDQLCVAIGNFTGQPTTLHCQVPGGTGYYSEMFTEQSHQAGLARPTLRMVTFGLFFFDADLDGWQDLLMVNGHVANEEQLRNVPYAQPPQLFRNRGDGTFSEVVPPISSALAHSLIGRGAAYADYDHDGDLDVLLTTNQGPAYLLRNDTPRTGAFLHVVTQGTRSNRDGIGAQLWLYTTNGRRLRGMVRTGSSYLSQSAMSATFGMQAGEGIDRLEILWPSGTREVFHDLPRNSTFVAREGTAAAAGHMAQQSALPVLSEASLQRKRAAIAHYQAGRFEAARGTFEQVLQAQPADYIAQQYLIELYWRLGVPEKAHTLLATMRQTFPEANFLMQFAFHLEEAQLPDLADLVYHEAAQLDPQVSEAPYRLGRNALRAGRYEAAIGHFRAALQRQAGLVEAQQGLGLAYVEQGQDGEAEQAFREVLRVAPEHAEAYTHLGALYMRQGRLQEALAAYRQVVRLQPDRPQGHHNLGVALAAQGRSDEAVTQFQAALRHDARYLPAYNDLGTLYAERGQLEQAIAAFGRALEIDADAVPTRYNLALAYGMHGDREAMQGHLLETLRRDPRHRDAHLNLGISYLQGGQIDLAMAQLRRLTEHAPRDAEAHYMLAVAYAQSGQPEDMLRTLQHVVRLNPNHARAHSTLAAFYLQQQQYDLAWQHASLAARLGAPVQPLLEALQKARPQPTR